MTFDRDFLEMMDHVITVRPFAGYSTDGYGSRSFSTGTYNLACYIDKTNRLVKDGTGKDVVSTTAVYAPPYDNSTGRVAVTVKVQDQIVWPVGLNPTNSTQAPPIISVQALDDETGAYCQVIYL